MFIKKNKIKKNKKIGFICLLALGFIIAIFSIVYYANNIKYQKQPESPEMAKLKKFLIENGEEFKIPKVNTLTWKTFYDKENGFKFKYPRGWVVEKSDENSWGFKELWNIRNPEDDEPPSQSKGEVDYITHDVVNFSIFDYANLKNEPRIKNTNTFIDSFINSSKERLEKKEGDVFYGFIDRYIYIYDGHGELYLFLNSNNIMSIYNSYFGEKKEEYFKIYYGVLKTLKFD
ncbi:MAG: hypothetical protein V1688_04515 [bacterium]